MSEQNLLKNHNADDFYIVNATNISRAFHFNNAILSQSYEISYSNLSNEDKERLESIIHLSEAIKELLNDNQFDLLDLTLKKQAEEIIKQLKDKDKN